MTLSALSLTSPGLSYEGLMAAIKPLIADDPDSFYRFTLTPALAEDLLQHDAMNRPLRVGDVEQYVRAMTEGRWYAARSLPIMFRPSGQMADGQHRCHAVMKSGVAIETRAIVVPDTYGVDEGVPRSLTDYLRLTTGIEKNEAPIVASVTRRITPTPKASEQELMDSFLARRDFILDCVRKPAGWLDGKLPIIKRAIPWGLLANVRAGLIENGKDANEVDEFLADVVEGGLAGGDKSYARQVHNALLTADHERTSLGVGKLLTMASDALDHQRSGIVKNLKLMARGKRPKKTT